MTSTTPIIYTSSTPNGRRVTIFLEELKAAYGFQYDVHPIELSKGTHKEEWFQKLSISGKVPILVDRQRGDMVIFESSAILLYLQHHYDKDKNFGFTEGSDEYFQLLQWLYFVHGNIASAGQNYAQTKRSGENAPLTLERNLGQLKANLSSLEKHLSSGRQYLAGEGSGKYTIADMNAVAFVRSHAFFDIPTLDEWPNVKAWLARVTERPAVQSGVAIPA